MANLNKPTKKQRQNTVVQKPNEKIVQEKVSKPETIYSLLIKVVSFSIIILSIIYLSDSKGFFNPDYSNDHTRRKWNAYYEFTKKQPVDVVLVGNSHLYTGLNPENLSTALGASCFILASPGTTMTDTYFALKEAIAVCKPKIAIVETFTMNDYDSHKLKNGVLSDQFKSFAARKNIGQKLQSTPILFTSDNYLPAWSNTLRNHSFIFSDTTQINKNIKLINSVEQPNQGLYLGRYIRFTSGLEDSTLLKYDKPGFVGYDYNLNLPSVEAKMYLRKTIELCKKNNIKLVLMTLPMYYKHVHNYNLYKEEIISSMNNTEQHWLDLQQPYDTTAFGPECFENTVSGNQHMTYYGSRVTAYKLAKYIRQELPNVLPDRTKEIAWKQLFYACDGYFENNPPENDGVSQVLLQNTVIQNGYLVNELCVVPAQGAKKIIIKIDKKNQSLLYGKSIILKVQVEFKTQKMIIDIPLICNLSYDPLKYFVFASEPMNPALNILGISQISVE
ncbi:MAG: hypothetical protein PHS59_01935 [Paludibacter sp.]|nr:hypothetical protein [Paludibacter sp.]